ncbi:MAG: amino acid adenylation domain-containing protein [Spirochaetota bacterium]
MINTSLKIASYIDGFDQQVAKSPTADALTSKTLTYTYQELALKAKSFALALKSYGIDAGDKVAVGVSRNEALVPLLLAIWSLRAAYVPVDPAFPVQRQIYILENSHAKIAICDHNNTPMEFGCPVVKLNELLVPASTMPVSTDVTLASDTIDESDIAYIIYTSGSTGNPKGVAISQANLINFIESMAVEPGLNYKDNLLAITTISFDIHILEIFLPLFVGAHLILATREESILQSALRELIDSRHISVIQATPATWRIILENGWQPERKLKILIGGEAFPIDLKTILTNVANEVWNMYGPTETTVWSTCFKVEEDNTIYIGKPIRNTQVYIVDDKLDPVSAGSSGELLIGGKGVALGYYNNDKLTAERFITLKSGDRVYRTGDLVKMSPDKNIEYINRIDNQLKIRGFRIEPSEIEQVLAKSDLVQQSVVVASEINAGDVRLIAFYAGIPDKNTVLRDLCKQYLPEYMVPQHFVCVTEFPLTANYKIDRKVLANEAIERFKCPEKFDIVDARDDLDRSLMIVWASLLGVKKISIDDNFFSLGGHSLLALQARKEMKKATGLDFPISVFFETPTIRQIRTHLGKSEIRASSVIKLNESKHGDPIFCLAGVQIYAELAEHYKGLRPVYGIFASEEVSFLNAEANNESIDFSLDALVETYKSAILRQGKSKALTLVGLSFGGLMCLEVARKLTTEGIVVHNIYLLDSYTDISSYRSFCGLAEDTLKYIFSEGPLKMIKYTLKMMRGHLNSKRRKPPLHRAYNQKGREEAFDQAACVFMEAKNTYPFDCVLVKATDTDFGFGIRPYQDYRLKEYIKGNLYIHQVKADHEKMLAGVCATSIFEIMQQYEPESAIEND